LTNLGYPCGDDDELDIATRRALRAFQAEHDLEVTGEIDERTRRALYEEHGDS
jgi:hypothetical protein